MATEKPSRKSSSAGRSFQIFAFSEERSAAARSRPIRSRVSAWPLCAVPLHASGPLNIVAVWCIFLGLLGILLGI